jgi:hypothetical protein
LTTANPVHRHAIRHGGKLFLEANEADHRAVRLEPCGSPTWAPALLSGSFVGLIERGRVQILDGTHGSGIYGGDEPLQD